MFLPWPRRMKRNSVAPFPMHVTRRRVRRPVGLYFTLCTEKLEDRIAPAAMLSLPASGFSGATNSTAMNFPIGISALSDGAGHFGLASATLAVSYPQRRYAGHHQFPNPAGGHAR
jgi:hypothetical protein